ncbi:metallophosphoesterase [Culturomica sp.]|uniref:metallophosphoesterase n=1 Tax=Culturomica sp. TaxID=1926652 RepID=UPI000E82C603|nr:metallophosphoesterase [Culturomica sp.]HBO25500.1 metallophosphatase [Culturomica sp.]
MTGKNLVRYFLIVCFTAACFQAAVAKDHQEKQSSLSADGPYILYDSTGGFRMVWVGEDAVIRDTSYAAVPAGFSFPVVSGNGKHRFRVKLHTFERQPWKMPQPEKMLVISDPHGNLDCFVSVLKNNGVIDENYNWNFGDNRLVIIGDVFDRGKDVLPVFWLIYKLEQEAAEAGGGVSFTLGNHEEMVLRGDCRYTKRKYKELADSLRIAYQDLWQENSELGRWLRTRNLVQIIGNNLIVHAGLSAEFLKRKEAVLQMNETVGKGLSLNKEGRKAVSATSAFVFDTKAGPFWYRGMVKSADKYQPVYLPDVIRLLKKYKVDRILVGHTIFDDMTTFYQGRVIAVNVDNEENYEKGRGRGILIEGNKISVIYDKKSPEPMF